MPSPRRMTECDTINSYCSRIWLMLSEMTCIFGGMNLDEIRMAAAPICSRRRVRRLELFGSSARGDASESSDLDFCVAFEELPPAEYAKQFFGLLHDLEDTFHRTIDLLTARSIRKPSLKKSLQRDGVCVYG